METKRKRPTVAQVKALDAEILNLKNQNAALKRSNELIDEEINRLRELSDKKEKYIRELEDEIDRVHSRGFLKRLFNLD